MFSRFRVCLACANTSATLNTNWFVNSTVSKSVPSKLKLSSSSSSINLKSKAKWEDFAKNLIANEKKSKEMNSKNKCKGKSKNRTGDSDKISNGKGKRQAKTKQVHADQNKNVNNKEQTKANMKVSETTAFLTTVMKDGLKMEGDEDLSRVSARPAYMSVEREKYVLKKAEQMQVRDLTGEVPVPSFTYEVLKDHPSLLNMGLRERMDFLLIRWEALSYKKKMEYLNNPLRDLIEIK